MALAGCQRTPISRTFADFCDEALHGKNIAVEGYLALSNITICGEDTWGRAQCPLVFVAEEGQSGYIYDDHRLWIHLGSDPNQMRMPTNANPAELVVFDDAGQRVDPAAKIRVTGELSVSKSLIGDRECSIEVDAIVPVKS